MRADTLQSEVLVVWRYLDLTRGLLCIFKELSLLPQTIKNSDVTY